MNLEVQDKTTAFTFEYEQVDNNLPVDITTALITIFDSSGGELVNEVAMTIVDNKATHIVDFSVAPDAGTWTIKRNYKAELKIDGKFIPQLFDIAKYLFVNHVKDQDLFDESDELEDNAFSKSGDAESGGVNTLVDSRRIEIDDYWNGGLIKIWADGNTSEVTEHIISDFVSTTNTFTFAPDRTAVGAGDNYTVRRSYQKDINLAGDVVKTDLLKKDLLAYLVLDDYQLTQLIIYKTLERYFGSKKNNNADDDVFTDRYEYYRDLYNTEYAGLPLKYDLNEDGNIDLEQEDGVGQNITMNR